jgi:thiol:disulfide interchange protein/DsbC/DsbD-like thiol-disulfide interchange protein
MKRHSWHIAFLLMSFAAPSLAAAAGGLHTSVRAVADVRSLRPGGMFTVGVLVAMRPGWHTYWSNPGESGIATSVAWDLPSAIEAGPIQWPLPEKNIESGDILTYGYSGVTMLLVPMRAPATLRPGSTVTLKGTVSWLECEHVCVPGSGTVSVTLPVRAETPAADHADLFARYRSRVPAPFPAAGTPALTHEISGRTLLLIVRAAEGTSFAADSSVADFFPETVDDITVGRARATVTGHEARLAMALSSSGAHSGARTVRGIILYRLAGGMRQAYEIEVPVPASVVASLGAGEQSTRGILDQSFTTTTQAGGASIILYFLFAIMGGVLLNVMPCVLPVIALKVFGLVKLAGDRPAKIKRLGWMFSLGILSSFMLLAVIVILLQAAGQQVGWGFQFQEPLFVIAMSAVVFAFGLSLFGVFEIQVPGAAASGVGSVLAKKTERGGGYAASFWEGVFATVLATPCTAPFLGSALGFAFSQPPWIILSIFATVAVGMALPYLVLTARPAWLRFLPKPGEWMVTVKQFMGFLMMATLLWLLYILGKQLGMEAVVWTGAFLLTIGVGCWMIGRFATLVASRAKRLTVWGGAIVIAAAGYWVFLESALDVRSVIAGIPASAETGAPHEGIAWKPFTLAGLEDDLKGDKTVFVDFTAEWCLTCKLNEKSVMADAAVVGKFKDLDVVAVRADWTNRNPDITRLLRKFGRSGVPLYVVFPPGRRNEPIVLPEVITTGMVIGALEKAAARG